MASVAVLPGADRPRGRLRDPVPGARRGGASAARAGGRGAAARARRGAPTVATAAWPPRPASSSCCSRRCRWCAASGSCSSRASCSPSTCALTAGAAALAARAARGRAARRGRRRARCGRWPARRGARRGASCCAEPRRRAPRGAGAGAPRAALRSAVRRPRAGAGGRPRRSRVAGWGLDTQTKVESDVTSSCRRTSARCATSTRSSGRPASAARSTCSCRAATSPTRAVVAWMARYQARVLQRSATTTGRGCGRPTLCPALLAARPLRARARPRRAPGRPALLDAVPPYFSQARHHAGPPGGHPRVRHPADAARRPAARCIDDMRARLRPAPGRARRLAGLPVLAAEANDAYRRPVAAAARRCSPACVAVGARAARGLPPLARALRPARPDRAGHGLVGARAVRAARSRSTRCR